MVIVPINRKVPYAIIKHIANYKIIRISNLRKINNSISNIILNNYRNDRYNSFKNKQF